MELKTGEIMTVPEFIYKGKEISDPDDRQGILKTIITSADGKTKYYKVRLFKSLSPLNGHVIMVKQENGVLTIPDFKIKRRPKPKSQALPMFGD